MKVPTYNGEIIVLGGLAKTGTTLPLTLLDGHPDLLVFPEELRFFHTKTDQGNAEDALREFLREPNIQLLQQKKARYEEGDYSAHGGSGFGMRDYSGLDFDLFSESLLSNASVCKSTFDRFAAIISAFETGLGLRTGESQKFVFKAPNSERFVKKWLQNFPDSTKFVITTRIPTEHYLSRRNVSILVGRKPLDPFQHSFEVMKNFYRKWSKVPEDRLLIVDYDKLIGWQAKEMERICRFLGIASNDNLSVPTKMGVPWAGNSIRGMAQEVVFENPHKASVELTHDEIDVIEDVCAPLYSKMGWKRIAQIESLESICTSGSESQYVQTTAKKLMLKLISRLG